MTDIVAEEISAGDTSEVWEVGFVTSVPGALPIELADLSVGFSCRIYVQGADPEIDRAVTSLNDDSTRFRAWLNPSETLALGRGKWKIGIELRNPALDPPLVKETHVIQKINPGVVPPS